jgi:sortase A
MARRPPSRRTLAWVERTLYAAALLLLGGWTAATLDAYLYGYFQQRRLDRALAANRADAATSRAAPLAPVTRPVAPAPSPPPAPARSSIPEVSLADLVGRIEIPRLGLRAIIAEGTDNRTLRRAVGHLRGTPRPGESGNVVLAGHRDTFFRALKDVRAEDIVRITTPQGRFEYLVEATAVVEATRTDVLAPTAEPSVTLVTCYPFYLVGDAPDRFIVRARLLRTESD